MAFKTNKKQAKRKNKSLFTRGRAEVIETSSYLKVEAGESRQVILLEGIDNMAKAMFIDAFENGKGVSFPCRDQENLRDCIGVKLGFKPKPKYFLTVMDENKNILVWQFGVGIYKDLLQVEKVINRDLEGVVISVSREGKGLSTKWSVMPTGRSVSVAKLKLKGDDYPDLDELLDNRTDEQIIKALDEAGFDTEFEEDWDFEEYEDEDEDEDEEDTAPAPKKSKSKKSSKKSKKSKAKVIEDEEDDEMDIPFDIDDDDEWGDEG